VRHRHELSQSWSTEYGVVRSFEVRNDEVDVVNMEVVGVAELDWQRDLTQRLRGLPREHSPEKVHRKAQVFWLDA
jgi:hypothetical protein